MFGNYFCRKNAHHIGNFADRFAEEILADVRRLDSEQAERFFGWLEQHFHENNFDPASSSPEERLRFWLSLQSPVLLLLEHQIILEKVEHFRSNDEEKN